MARSRSALTGTLLVVIVAALGGGAWVLFHDARDPAPAPPSVVVAPPVPQSPLDGRRPPLVAPPRPAPDDAADAPPATDAAAPAPPAPGTVVGRIVWPDRRGIAGAAIELRRGIVRGLRGENESLPLLDAREPAVTDASGAFRLEEVAPVTDLVVRASGEAFVTHFSGPLRLSPGGTLDLGDVVVDRGSRLVVTVLDPSGQEHPGARVGLYTGLAPSAPAGAPTPRPERLVLTDEDGLARFDAVPPGPLTVETVADGHARVWTRTTVGVIEQADTEERLVVSLVTPHVVRGVVVGADGAPLEGASVAAIPAGTIGAARSETTTGPDGSFALDDLLAGDYLVQASHAGHRAGSAHAYAEAPRELLIALEPLGGARGVVLGADGEPVSRFEIRALFHRRKIDEPFPSLPARRVTDPDGAFAFEGLEPGYYTFEAWSKGHALTRGGTVRVVPGRVAEGAIVQLDPIASLSGLVVDDGGAAVAGARVTLHVNRETAIESFRDLGNEGRIFAAPVTTDREGRFVFPDVSAGTYQVMVDHLDHAPLYRDDVTVAAGAARDVGVLTLARAGTIRGVALASNGDPVAGIDVSLGGAGIARHTRTDGRGAFTFTRLPPGRYTLMGLAASNDLGLLIKIATTNKRLEIELGPGEERTETVYVVQ